MNNQKVELSASLLNAVVAYLAKQPFEQVANMISAIQQETQGSQLPPNFPSSSAK